MTAKLVTFSICTRVVVPCIDPEDLEAYRVARNKILNDPGSFVTLDNLADVEEDIEVPYGEIESDKIKQNIERLSTLSNVIND